MTEFKGMPALDAGHLACAQAVEHYEISRYGTLKCWAEELGLRGAAALLDATLKEEKATDSALTALAKSVVTSKRKPNSKRRSEQGVPRRLVFASTLDKPAERYSSSRVLPLHQENQMDKDRIEGSVEQAKGKVKEVAGKVTGDSKLQSEGKAEQVAGKIQNAVGGIKDTLRGK